MANNTIRRIKFLAVRDRISIAAVFVDAGALKFFTAGVSTSPVCSGNVMGEFSSGLLKSDSSPAVAGDKPSVPPTTVNANSDTRGAEKNSGRQHEAVSIDIAGGELQLGLHELLHLPFVGAAIPGHAEQATGTPVADQIGLGQAAIIGDAKPLGRAAVTPREPILFSAKPCSLMPNSDIN